MTEHLHSNISTTIHAMTKTGVPCCPAHNSESTDVNCLVFGAHFKNGKILMKIFNENIKSIIRGFWVIFKQHGILILLECMADYE